MAHFASCRETGVRHRTICIVEIDLVAGNAERAVQLVVIVDVAIHAGSRWNGMRARQWESSLRVVEFGVGPLHGVVTLLAGSRKSRVRHRTDRVVEILLMARNASRIRDVVVVGAVTVRARPRGHGVRTGQGKRGFGMVKRRRLPCRSRVAKFATLRKAARHVVGILRAGEIALVASDACPGRQVVAAKFRVMAIRALPRRHGMHPR